MLFSLNVRWHLKNLVFFTFMLVLPNFLSVFNLPTPYGFNIHFFQIAIILAAMLFGPIGGAAAGLMGSLYSALAMHNPYLIVGNIILGFFVGVFFRYKWNVVSAVVAAFAIQLPWLVATDYYLVHMPLPIIGMLAVTLFVSNVIWASVAHYAYAPVARFIE